MKAWKAMLGAVLAILGALCLWSSIAVNPLLVSLWLRWTLVVLGVLCIVQATRVWRTW